MLFIVAFGDYLRIKTFILSRSDRMDAFTHDKIFSKRSYEDAGEELGLL